MHVLYFHQYFSTRQGGTGTRSYEMARRLIDAGHQVTMVCASYGPANTGLSGPFHRGRREGIVDGIRVLEFELPCSNEDGFLKRTWTFLKYSLRSSWFVITSKYHLLFATSTPLTAGIPGIVGRWFRWKPFVFEVRDLWPELPKAMGVITNPVILFAMSVLERTSYRSARHCIGLAPGIVEGIVRHIPASRVSMIPNGCDLDLHESAKESTWRPDGIGADDFVAVFSGTHGPANGLEAVLSAAEALQERGRDEIKLLLIGDGRDKEQLVDQAVRRKLSNVVFHDRVSKERLAGLLASSNVGLQILANIPAFYYGTSPNKFFDYLAIGLPVLTNYPGWVADLVQQHECGKAVPPDNPTAFADALIKLADDRDGCLTMGERARSLAEAQFSRPKLGQQFVDVLTAAAGQPGS